MLVGPNHASLIPLNCSKFHHTCKPTLHNTHHKRANNLLIANDMPNTNTSSSWVSENCVASDCLTHLELFCLSINTQRTEKYWEDLTQITHLLCQTDSYLSSLTPAVQAQQAKGGVSEHTDFKVEDGPASEVMFGTQAFKDNEDKMITVNSNKVDYYAVVHRVSKRFTKQSNMLVGGMLKDYQLKGLQKMELTKW